jgi:hypothetical protein
VRAAQVLNRSGDVQQRRQSRSKASDVEGGALGRRWQRSTHDAARCLQLVAVAVTADSPRWHGCSSTARNDCSQDHMTR